MSDRVVARWCFEVRINAAEQNSWLGDVDQLRVTMNHLQNKRSALGQVLDETSQG